LAGHASIEVVPQDLQNTSGLLRIYGPNKPGTQTFHVKISTFADWLRDQLQSMAQARTWILNLVDFESILS
jgi:hypothetical protein